MAQEEQAETQLLAYSEVKEPSSQLSEGGYRKALKDKWIEGKALLLARDGKAYIASAISKSKTEGWTIKAEPIGATYAARSFRVSDIARNDPGLDKIIFNMFTTEIKSDVQEVMVKRATQPTGESGAVLLELSGRKPGEKGYKKLPPMATGEFMQRFPPTELTRTHDWPSRDFDFEPYPKLLETLRVAKAFATDDSATEMPKDSAAALMLAMRAKQGIL